MMKIPAKIIFPLVNEMLRLAKKVKFLKNEIEFLTKMIKILTFEVKR